MAAYTKAVEAAARPGDAHRSEHDDGHDDASFFRAVGIPVYGVDGGWGISPDDERAHGLDERIPVRAAYDNLLHWETMIRELAGR